MKKVCITNNDSSNTSLPPSGDQKDGKPANIYNGREKTARKAGGQKGHKGTTLTKAEAAMYCAILSIVETLKRRNMAMLEHIRLFMGTPAIF